MGRGPRLSLSNTDPPAIYGEPDNVPDSPNRCHISVKHLRAGLKQFLQLPLEYFIVGLLLFESPITLNLMATTSFRWESSADQTTPCHPHQSGREVDIDGI